MKLTMWPGNYESGTSETDPLVVRQQRKSAIELIHIILTKTIISSHTKHILIGNLLCHKLAYIKIKHKKQQ